ncbi:hypothetical protein AB0M44_13660 [Streptosporangium subroseum]|uniref:hypothetical protein n=1 Tax=Streptosporangium subroseum TaxID=106412 RepID=UPI0034495981
MASPQPKLKVAGRSEAGPTTAGNGHAGNGRPFWTMRRRDNLAGYLLVAPQLLGSVLFVLLPLGLVLWYSLHEWNVPAGTFEFVGGENYDKLIADPNLRGVPASTALFSVGLVVLNLGLALALAILFNQRLRGTTFSLAPTGR